MSDEDTDYKFEDVPLSTDLKFFNNLKDAELIGEDEDPLGKVEDEDSNTSSVLKDEEPILDQTEFLPSESDVQDNQHQKPFSTSNPGVGFFQGAFNRLFSRKKKEQQSIELELQDMSAVGDSATKSNNDKHELLQPSLSDPRPLASRPFALGPLESLESFHSSNNQSNVPVENLESGSLRISLPTSSQPSSQINLVELTKTFMRVLLQDEWDDPKGIIGGNSSNFTMTENGVQTRYQVTNNKNNEEIIEVSLSLLGIKQEVKIGEISKTQILIGLPEESDTREEIIITAAKTLQKCFDNLPTNGSDLFVVISGNDLTIDDVNNARRELKSFGIAYRVDERLMEQLKSTLVGIPTSPMLEKIKKGQFPITSSYQPPTPR